MFIDSNTLEVYLLPTEHTESYWFVGSFPLLKYPSNCIFNTTATEGSSGSGHLSPEEEVKDHSMTNTLLKCIGLEVIHTAFAVILLLRTRHKATFNAKETEMSNPAECLEGDLGEKLRGSATSQCRESTIVSIMLSIILELYQKYLHGFH